MKPFNFLRSSLTVLALFALASCTPTPSQAVENSAAQQATAFVQPQEAAPATDTTQANPVAQTVAGESQEQTLINLYKTVNPAVVNIQVIIPSDANGSTQSILPNIPNLPNMPQFEQPSGPQQAQGSGFVYDMDGHIITNNHVVAGASKITVTFSDDTQVEATLVGTDPGSDLAVIQVDVPAELLHPLTLGDSSALQVGQSVVAIGNPFGLDGSMTTGIVSGLGRLLPTEAATPNGQRFSIPNVIQTDTAINPGNSGGPLLNLHGEVVGINTAIESPVHSFAGIGYSVPSNNMKEIVPLLIAGKEIVHPWLGISGTELTAVLAKAMDLDENQRGVLIMETLADGPADKADLHGSDTTTTIDGLDARIGGDIITGIDDQTVRGFDDLLSYVVGQTEVGQTVTLHILRDGKPQEVKVTLEARPSDN